MDRNTICATHADDRRDAIWWRPGDGDSRSRCTLIDGGRRVERSARSSGEPAPRLYIVPEVAQAFVTCGEDDARAFASRPPADLVRARAIFASRREALQLTGEETVERAGARLAALAETAVVTLGGEGAIAFSGSDTVAFAYENVEHPVDTTGAGDLLAAAYIWAELRGAEPADRLRWAVLYATLAVKTPTGIGGAITEAELTSSGVALGLTPPPLAGVV